MEAEWAGRRISSRRTIASGGHWTTPGGWGECDLKDYREHCDPGNHSGCGVPVLGGVRRTHDPGHSFGGRVADAKAALTPKLRQELLRTHAHIAGFEHKTGFAIMNYMSANLHHEAAVFIAREIVDAMSALVEKRA